MSIAHHQSNARQIAINDVLTHLRTAWHNRKDALFTRFLPLGYEMTTLSCVEDAHFEQLLLAKVRLGTLIAIYDDLADNPAFRNDALLDILYEMPFSSDRLSSNPVAILCIELWNEVLTALQKFPNFHLLKNVWKFDVQQFYNANRYSQLISANPNLSNQCENRAYGAHNMGILIVGTMDLMASTFCNEELGRMRRLFYGAQSIARISNVLTTLDREIAEGDPTGEVLCILIEQGRLNTADFVTTGEPPNSLALNSVTTALAQEQENLFNNLSYPAQSMRSFDGIKYLDSMQKLQKLHENMLGVI